MQLTSGVLAPTTIFTQDKKKEEGIGKSTMDQQDFLNLLVEQLKHQDPLSPLDNADFMAQTTAFSQLDEMMNMNKSMANLLEIMQQQANNNSGLLTGTNFLGKQIEFLTNTVTLGDGLSNMSFYLGDTPDATKSEIRIYNANGELATIIKPNELKKGENIINWDGKGVGGTNMPDGVYTFEINAFTTKGDKIEVSEYGKGIVQGVKNVEGVLYFDIGNGVVSSEYVYSVSDAPKADKPDADKPTDDTDKKS